MRRRERGPACCPAPGARCRECLTWQFSARLNSARGEPVGTPAREGAARAAATAGVRAPGVPAPGAEPGSGKPRGGGSDQVTPGPGGTPPEHSWRGAGRPGGAAEAGAHLSGGRAGDLGSSGPCVQFGYGAAVGVGMSPARVSGPWDAERRGRVLSSPAVPGPLPEVLSSPERPVPRFLGGREWWKYSP